MALLNPAAALIWDLLIETHDADATTAAYGEQAPERATRAREDVSACLATWNEQGFFHAPDASEEAQQVREREDRLPELAAIPAFQRTFSVAGVPTRLEIMDPTLARVVSDLTVDFPHTGRPAERVLQSTSPQDGWTLFIDGRLARIAENLPLARGQIVAELVRIAGRKPGWRATVHGAALTGPQGPILLAGESGAGKSTLSAGLVARGWRILAEDIAAFGEDWKICPLPFALSIKDGAVETLAPDFPDLPTARVHQLGPRRVRYQGLPAEARAQQAQRPHMFLEVRHDAAMSDASAEVERLSEIEALGLFMNEESYIGFDRDDTGDFLDFIARTPAYRIRYGTIAAADRALRVRLERHLQDEAT